MNCHDANELFHAYADGELDLVRNLEMEQHVASCPACAAAIKNARTLKASIAGGSLYYHSPPALRRSVLAAISEGSASSSAEPWWRSWRLWASLGFACLALIATSAFLTKRPTPSEQLIAELRAGHVRSIMTRHLTDITSADHAAVQRWFEGKLDFVPNVAELSGYSLVGGRMDFVNDRPMAALVYKRNDQLLSVFVWRMTCEDEFPDNTATTSKDGINLQQWNQGSVAHAAVSDAKPEELKGVATAMQK